MSLLLQAATRSSELPGGYGVALLQTLLALAAVCILAWVVLRWSAQRGLGIGQGQRIKLVERVALDARRTAFLVEVGGKLFFLAAGDAGPPALVAELDPADVPEPERRKTFLEVLRGSAAATSPTAAPSVAAASEPEHERVAEVVPETRTATEDEKDQEGAA